MGKDIAAVGIDQRRVDAQLERERAAHRRLVLSRTWPWMPDFGLELEIAIVDALGYVIHRTNVAIKTKLGDPRVTCEVADFECELNLTPVPAGGRPFLAMYREINLLLEKITVAAAKFGGTPVIVGIVPTLDPEDTSRDWMTPDNDRYRQLDTALDALYPDRRITIRGTDAIDIAVRSVIDEAACLSQQLHIRTTPEQFRADMDAARITAGPGLAIGANSPILYGMRLGHAVRPQVFSAVTQRTPFGSAWSPDLLESFDAATLQPSVLAEDYAEDPLAVLEAGGIPVLRATTIANGSWWDWHRPIYHYHESDPHYRIEIRPDCAQPSVVDVVAQAAFQAGVSLAIARDIQQWHRAFPPEYMGDNFLAAQANGPTAQLHWLVKGQVETLDACELVLEHAVPLARLGLAKYGVDREEIDWLMGVIAGRAIAGETGSTYQLRVFTEALTRNGGNRRLASETMFTRYRRNQRSGQPVHTWHLLDARAT